ncbi:MAG: peptide chain release factor 2 [Clostridiales Family XIII bacterium]|jgi:peptide chain release factor 2|nr:peptide chain release factor 2 [Clostridiales Family XIII bacterium]
MIELEQIRYELDDAKGALAELRSALGYDVLAGRLAEITSESEKDGFWDDHEAAQKLLKERKAVEGKVKSYDSLVAELGDVEIMIGLADEENDESIVSEIQESYDKWNADIESLRIRTLLGDEYDLNNAYVEINAGAGGTDAQDWAEMLLRMYMRWSERRGYKAKMLDLQDDTVAGIKSARFFVEGEYAYGYLKNEQGVHRIVRISPFDSSSRRHTSFASVAVTPEIDDDINIEIDPDDIRVDTFRSSGAGGQHVNKTDSAIRITHLPTNIVVTCQNERSQHQNKDVAMKALKSKLYELARKEQKESLDELKGDYGQIAWGSQIRSYVFHPYSLVKDHRTGAENGNVQAVMDGDIDLLINEKLKRKEV